MEEKIDTIKSNYNINEVFPITPIVLKKNKVYLFSSLEYGVHYSLYTDGNVEHLDTWGDKKPYDRDPFLEGCQPECGKWVDRFEFYVTDANVLLVEKKYKDKMVRNLYIDQDNIYKVINNHLYQVSVNPKQNLMIKKIGER